MSYRPKATAAFLLAATLLVSPLTHAEEQDSQKEDRIQLNSTLGYVLPTLDTLYGEVTPALTVFTLGMYGTYLGVELRAGLGLGYDTDINGNTYATDEYFGLFGRLNFVRSSSKVVPYGVLGYHRWEVDVPAAVTGEVDGSGGALGLGLEFKVTDKVALSIEYTKWFENVDALAFGIDW